MASHAGRLLVASPHLLDPNFHQAVVLLVEHSAEGAAGLVLNRPGPLPLDEVLPTWAPLAAEPRVLHVGGPVAPESLLALGLGLAAVGPAALRPVVGALGLIDLQADAAKLSGQTSVRVFHGYAGWGPLQLEGELDEGAWFVLDAEEGDAVIRRPRDLWRTVLGRQEGVLSHLATYPPDVRSN